MRIGVLSLSGVLDGEVFTPQMLAAGIEKVTLHELTDLDEIDGFLLVGEENALRDFTHDPLLDAIHQQSERGKPLLGIGLGAALLVARGWVPGLENNKPAIRLVDRPQQMTDSAMCFIRLTSDYQRNAFTRHTTLQDIYSVAAVSAAKSFAMSKVLYDEIQHQGLNVWVYCSKAGEVLNNEIENVAAISNKRGNVLAMVPALSPNEKGEAIFASMRDYITKGLFSEVAPLNYYPR